MCSRILRRTCTVLRTRCPHLLSIDTSQSVRYLLTNKNQNVTPTAIKETRKQLQEVVGTSAAFNEQRDISITSLKLASKQADLLPRRMLDSYRKAHIPIGSDLKLREKYINFHNAVRFGRIMEDLDTMAVWISYTHNHDPSQGPNQKSPLSIVTATVDQILIKKKVILPDQDIFIDGHVTWVGSSSMEVTMNVEQEQNGTMTHLLEAHFLMVARDPQNRCKAFVHPLVVEGPEEDAIVQQGEANKKMRAQQANESLLKIPPSAEERIIIHQLFLSTLDENLASFRHPMKPDGSIWMEDALLKNISICFPEKRNLYNKIFGGFLMRKAYELGWANCCVYSKMRPHAIAVDDISFRKPVEVGSLLYLSSQVTYTNGRYLQVKVHAEVVDPKTRQHETTNVFHFTFITKYDVPQVVPKSYAEYMTYVDGKRHFEASVNPQ